MNEIIIKADSISVGYEMYTKEEYGVVNVAIPAFKIFFTCNHLSEAEQKSNVMFDSFMDFWLEQKDFRKFILQINKLGFKAKQHSLVMHNLLKKRREQDAKFLIDINRDQYKNFDKSEVQKSIAA